MRPVSSFEEFTLVSSFFFWKFLHMLQNYEMDRRVEMFSDFLVLDQ